MNIEQIVSELRAEKTRIDRAISALEGVSSNGAAARSQLGARSVKPKQHRLSAEGRKRLSELMKKRWAERRKKAAKR